MARVPGRDRDKPALVLHGHLDVVPAIAEDWSVDPFEGVVRDGMLWGRGAVDMKDMDAMILTSVADLLRAGEQPERDLVLAFFADEENGGVEGSALVVAEPAGVVRRRDRGDQRGRRILDRRSAIAARTSCRWGRRRSSGSGSSRAAVPRTAPASTPTTP